MPTLRPRYTVTETDELRRSLDELARQHPELRDDRNALFRQLVSESIRRFDASRGEWLARRRAALREVDGKYTGGWPDSWRASRHAEWPE